MICKSLHAASLPTGRSLPRYDLILPSPQAARNGCWSSWTQANSSMSPDPAGTALFSSGLKATHWSLIATLRPLPRGHSSRNSANNCCRSKALHNSCSRRLVLCASRQTKDNESPVGCGRIRTSIAHGRCPGPSAGIFITRIQMMGNKSDSRSRSMDLSR